MAAVSHLRSLLRSWTKAFRSEPLRRGSRPRAVRIPVCAAFVLATLCTALAQGPPDRSVVEKLQKGGYVLYARHFQTDPNQGDTDPYHPENTSAQRQLTDAGRAQATEFGRALRALGIPVGKVLCSLFQRTHESAKLIGAGEPVPTADVSEIRWVKSPEEKQRRIEALRSLLSTPPQPGKNTLIVSHRPNLQEAAGDQFESLGEGEVVVFEPGGDGKFRMVARVYPPSIWTDWSPMKTPATGPVAE